MPAPKSSFALFLKPIANSGSLDELSYHSKGYLVLARKATANISLHYLTQSSSIFKLHLLAVFRAFSLFLVATASSLFSYPPSSLACRYEDYRSGKPSHVDCVSMSLKICFVHIGVGMTENQGEDSMVTRWISGSKTWLVRSGLVAMSDALLVILLMDCR